MARSMGIVVMPAIRGTRMFTFNEFFAGGGFVRLGFGDAWTCSYANDIDAAKGKTYRMNFDGGKLTTKDIRTVTAAELTHSDVAHASFPCQDHTTAGPQPGFGEGTRGLLVFVFLALMQDCARLGKAPDTIVLENVSGLTGKDLEAVLTALISMGYKVGPLSVDARLFVPQSRPRLFIVAVKTGVPVPKVLLSRRPEKHWHTRAIQKAVAGMAPVVRRNLVWWKLPLPPVRTSTLEDIVEPFGSPNEKWRDKANVDMLLATCKPADRERLKAAQRSGRVIYGIVVNKPGTKATNGRRSLVFRLDGLSGCLMKKVDLRYQQLCRIDGDDVRIRPMTRLELARLMGLPANYRLPQSVSKTAQLTGDGVVVPVVRWIAQHLLEPLAEAARAQAEPVAQPLMRAPPQRVRKDLPAVTGEGTRGVKQTTYGNTVYLLPEERVRLSNMALECGVPMQEIFLRGLDALYMHRGQPPVRRPLPRLRGRAAAAAVEGDIVLTAFWLSRARPVRTTSGRGRDGLRSSWISPAPVGLRGSPAANAFAAGCGTARCGDGARGA